MKIFIFLHKNHQNFLQPYTYTHIYIYIYIHSFIWRMFEKFYKWICK